MSSYDIPTMYAYGELEDGTEWANLRVGLPTKIQLERTAKANRWDTEEDEFTVSAFMSWHLSRAKGLHNLSWDEFLKAAIDAGVTGKPVGETAPDDGEAATEDPTRPGAGTE